MINMIDFGENKCPFCGVLGTKKENLNHCPACGTVFNEFSVIVSNKNVEELEHQFWT